MGAMLPCSRRQMESSLTATKTGVEGRPGEEGEEPGNIGCWVIGSVMRSYKEVILIYMYQVLFEQLNVFPNFQTNTNNLLATHFIDYYNWRKSNKIIIHNEAKQFFVTL